MHIKSHDQLRKAAENKLTNSQAKLVNPQPSDELLHELQIHQIELEMQNENLRQSQTLEVRSFSRN
jgi:hypothetical protein